MWRRKATVIGVLWLTAGCAAVQDRQSTQMAGLAARPDADVPLEGCLLSGSAPGTFVLAGDVRAVDVMSTHLGLSAYVGRRVAVRGQEEPTPSRSIHDGARLFKIRSLEVVEAECRTSG
jgi:hypothetical protein